MSAYQVAKLLIKKEQIAEKCTHAIAHAASTKVRLAIQPSTHTICKNGCPNRPQTMYVCKAPFHSKGPMKSGIYRFLVNLAKDPRTPSPVVKACTLNPAYAETVTDV
jgi:hypothetical protein